MNRFEVWILHLSTFLVSLTGLVYAYMHYEMKAADPFSVINHPLEPYMMALHILTAPALILAAGLIVHSHILWKLKNGSRIARKTGILLIPVFAVMVLSGYLLQVITASWRSILVGTHLISGVLWFGAYVGHQIASLRFRRSMNSQADALRIP
jgi:hypothetical protein